MDTLFQTVRNKPMAYSPVDMPIWRNTRAAPKVARSANRIDFERLPIVPVVIFDCRLPAVSTAKIGCGLHDPFRDRRMYGSMGAVFVSFRTKPSWDALFAQKAFVPTRDNLGVPAFGTSEARPPSRLDFAHAAFPSFMTRSYMRSMAYAFDARGSLCSPLAMREIVPCGTPVSSLMADCVHPILISSASFSDVFMKPTIRTRIELVNTLSHYSFTNNSGMEFKEWLQAEMTARELTPSALAGLAKVPQPTIFRILSGETKDPRTGTVKKLERALGAESPPLEAPPTEHQELNEAWAYLLPGERQELLKRIKQLAAHNREAADHFKPKVVRVADMRKRQVNFDGPDRRQQKESGDE